VHRLLEEEDPLLNNAFRRVGVSPVFVVGVWLQQAYLGFLPLEQLVIYLNLGTRPLYLCLHVYHVASRARAQWQREGTHETEGYSH